MNYNRTMLQCPRCGQYTPDPDKCVYCGADVHSLSKLKTKSLGKNEHFESDTRKKLNPRLCCYAWYRCLHRQGLEYLRKKAEKDFLMATMGGNPIEHSDWYRVMRMYIDAYTDKVISCKKCYKYGLDDIDESVRNGFFRKGKLGYCHAFWLVKKVIIKQDYDLIWYTPQEMEPDTRFD